MDTEFSDQKSESDLCVHRVSLRGFAAAVKCYRARCAKPQIKHRGTMNTEFPEESLSGLCVHRASAVKSYRAS
jgi:hypothetical protein